MTAHGQQRQLIRTVGHGRFTKVGSCKYRDPLMAASGPGVSQAVSAAVVACEL